MGAGREEADQERDGALLILDEHDATEQSGEKATDSSECDAHAPRPSDAEVVAARRSPVNPGGWWHVVSNASPAVGGTLRSLFGGRQRDDG